MLSHGGLCYCLREFLIFDVLSINCWKNLGNPFEYGYNYQIFTLFCRTRLIHFVRYIPV